MALDRVLNSVRKGSRANKLRDVSGEDAEQMLDAILTEALAAQASGSRKMMRNSLQELKQTRQDIITQQINIDKKAKQKYVASMTAVGKQIKNKFEEGEQKFSQATESIANSLPSADTLVSAVMTANPIVGYGIKMFKDITGSLKTSQSRSEEENQKRLAVLQEQKDSLEFERDDQSSELLDELINTIEQEMSLLKEKISKSNLLLQRIDTNTYNLAVEFGADIGDTLREINDSQLTMNELFDKDISERKRQDIEGRRESSGGSGLRRVPEDEGEDGMFDFMDDLNIGGMGSMLAGFMKPIGSLLTGLLMFGKLALKATGIGAVVYSLYNFVDGFMNAGDIVGKKEEDLTITDRIAAGVSSVISSFLKLIDWVSNLFGIDFLDTEGDLTKRVYEKMSEIGTAITDFFGSIVGWIKDKFGEYGKKIGELTSGIQNVFGGVLDYVQKIVDAYKEGGFSAVADVVMSDAKDTATNVVDNVSEYAGDKVNQAKEGASDLYSGVKGMLGFGDEDPATERLRQRKQSVTNTNAENVNVINNVSNNYATGGNGKNQTVYVPGNTSNQEMELRYVNKDFTAGLVR